jgi:hypothetical protein
MPVCRRNLGYLTGDPGSQRRSFVALGYDQLSGSPIRYGLCC